MSTRQLAPARPNGPAYILRVAVVSLGNPGPSGWAFEVGQAGRVLTVRQGGLADASLAEAELCGVAEALRWLPVGSRAQLLTPSARGQRLLSGTWRPATPGGAAGLAGVQALLGERRLTLEYGSWSPDAELRARAAGQAERHKRDLNAPGCPNCGSRMTRRALGGVDHWCCSAYPACRQRLRLS